MPAIVARAAVVGERRQADGGPSPPMAGVVRPVDGDNKSVAIGWADREPAPGSRFGKP